MEYPGKICSREWRTVSLTQTPLGLTAQERFERFRLEAISEMALRLVGGLMVAASTILWLILPAEAEIGRFLSHGVLAALCTGIGLAVYVYGTRGFRRQLALDARRRTLALTKININDQGRVLRTIGIDEVESLFLRRPATPVAPASLCVRMAGNDTPIVALTGDRAELEHVHRHLCDIVQNGGPRRGFFTSPAQPDAPRRAYPVRA